MGLAAYRCCGYGMCVDLRCSWLQTSKWGPGPDHGLLLLATPTRPWRPFGSMQSSRLLPPSASQGVAPMCVLHMMR